MAVVLPGKFVYLATPHTGSRSVRDALQGIEGTVTIDPHHISWADLQGHKEIKGGEIRFCAIRNPYDLLVTWWLKTGASPHKGKTFADFIARYHFAGQHCLYHHAPDADVVMEVESLEADLNAVLADCGLDPVDLPRINVTEGKQPWQSYYDAECIELANRRFAEEFMQYGYDPISLE